MRLLSYNIHKGVGGRDRRYRLPRIIEVIEAENPDLICLQEVVRSAKRCSFDDQPRLIADYFSLTHAMFQQNVHYKEGGYGNLLLSRWPLKHHHQVSLRMKTKKPRGAQIAVIDSPEGEVGLVNFHLGLSELERRWQIDHLLAHHLFREVAHLPTVLIGDANDWRNALEGNGLAASGLQQITHPPSKFRSFPSWLPVGSLDKAFFRGNLEVRSARIVRSPLTKCASDHLPLVIDFHLPNGHQGK